MRFREKKTFSSIRIKKRMPKTILATGTVLAESIAAKVELEFRWRIGHSADRWYTNDNQHGVVVIAWGKPKQSLEVCMIIDCVQI